MHCSPLPSTAADRDLCLMADARVLRGKGGSSQFALGSLVLCSCEITSRVKKLHADNTQMIVHHTRLK